MKTAAAAARTRTIDEYDIVGGEPAPSLESLARLAATLCAVPTAVVTIIDDRWQHQVAAVGFEAAVCAREDSMCAIVLPDAQLVVVGDARTDDRFAANPFVTGELGYVRFYASSPLVTPTGVAIGTLCVFDEAVGELTDEQRDALDLLARQAVEVLELRRATQELERSSAQLARFAGQVSHDLRNPLTAMIGQLDLAVDALDGGDAPRATVSLDRAESAAMRMDDMITGLLAYARVGGAQPARRTVSPRAVVEPALADLRHAIQEAHATIEVQIADEIGEIEVDPTLLGVLVQNLVANAVKFASASGVAPRIAVGVAPSGPEWTLTVDDNGPGVAPELRERVFGVMERGDAREVPGLGLGLATCRQVALAHRGRIVLEDSPLGGARVRVDLPLA